VSAYLHEPLFWVAVVFGTGVVFVAIEVVLMGRHLNKVDDLAHELHVDLTKAEGEIAELKAKLAGVLPGQRLRTMEQPVVKPVADTQSYGRHARKG
jgi:hypothetical protein